MCSPEITSPKRSVKRLDILSILRWALNDKITSKKHTQIHLHFDFYYMTDFLSLRAAASRSKRALDSDRDESSHERKNARWTMCQLSDSERKRAASTWTNDPPLIERWQTKGCWKTDAGRPEAPQRRLFVPGNKRVENVTESSTNTSWKQMWRISSERSY